MLLKTTVFVSFVLIYSLSCFSQIISADHFPTLNDKKGNLLVLNEMHGVASNPEVYIDVLKHLKTQLQTGDTINLFLEIPYSKSVLLNDYFKSQNHDPKLYQLNTSGYPSASFIDSIMSLHIPVRFFGCDFEYDELYKRNASFVYLLEKLSTHMALAKLNVSELDSYILSVKNFKIKSKNTEQLQRQLKQLEKDSPDSLRFEMGQALFALEAPQKFTSGRDGFIYERSLKAIKLGYFDYHNTFNVLIHGVAHVNPSFPKSLFNRFRNMEASPFVHHTYLIGNVYIGCRNDSGIFNKVDTGSTSFYPISSYNNPVVTYFQNKNFTSNNIYFISPEEMQNLNFPNLNKDELLGVYVHYKIYDRK